MSQSWKDPYESLIIAAMFFQEQFVNQTYHIELCSIHVDGDALVKWNQSRELTFVQLLKVDGRIAKKNSMNVIIEVTFTEGTISLCRDKWCAFNIRFCIEVVKEVLEVEVMGIDGIVVHPLLQLGSFVFNAVELHYEAHIIVDDIGKVQVIVA